MSDYTPNVDWSAKDALATGTAAKTISGVPFDAEFALIQTAVNSKLDEYVAVTEDTTLASGDMLSIYDLANTDYRRITVANAQAALSTANVTNFRANRSTAQASIGNEVFTKIQFDNEVVDVGNNYDDVPNYNFTCPVAGVYIFTATVNMAGMTDTDVLLVQLVGSTFGTLQSNYSQSSGAANLRAGVSAVVSCAAQETVHVEVWQNSGGVLSTAAVAASQWFAGARIG
jgi:hypothetical protein